MSKPKKTKVSAGSPPPGGDVSSSPEDGHVHQQWFTCDCGTSEHVFRLSYFPSDDSVERELFVSVFLQEFGFFGRCWAALKYVLGYKCRYGHWEEIILNREEALRFERLLKQARLTGI